MIFLSDSNALVFNHEDHVLIFFICTDFNYLEFFLSLNLMALNNIFSYFLNINPGCILLRCWGGFGICGKTIQYGINTSPYKIN